MGEAENSVSAFFEKVAAVWGAGDTFATCVKAGAQQRVATATANASRYISGLRPDHRFGTPSVVVNGAIINISDEGWLDQALSANRR